MENNNWLPIAAMISGRLGDYYKQDDAPSISTNAPVMTMQGLQTLLGLKRQRAEDQYRRQMNAQQLAAQQQRDMSAAARDKREFDYRVQRDAAQDTRLQDQTQYERGRDSKADARQEKLDALASKKSLQFQGVDENGNPVQRVVTYDMSDPSKIVSDLVAGQIYKAPQRTGGGSGGAAKVKSMTPSQLTSVNKAIDVLAPDLSEEGRSLVLQHMSDAPYNMSSLQSAVREQKIMDGAVDALTGGKAAPFAKGKKAKPSGGGNVFVSPNGYSYSVFGSK